MRDWLFDPNPGASPMARTSELEWHFCQLGNGATVPREDKIRHESMQLLSELAMHTERHKLPVLPAQTSCSHYGYMKEIGAREAKNQFGRFLDAAQRSPVRVTKKGRSVGVLLSEAQYEQLLGAAWQRLETTVEGLRAEAEESGLTEEALADMLRNS